MIDKVLTACVGKRVTRVFELSYSGHGVALCFDDGSRLVIRAEPDGDNDANLIFHKDLTLHEQKQTGLISQDDYNIAVAKRKSELEKIQTEGERASYIRLKAKFEGKQ